MRRLGAVAVVLLAVLTSPVRGEDAAPRSVISLNGPWQCAPGAADSRPSRWPHTVPVPGLVDLCVPPLKWEDHEYFWYRKTFHFDESPKQAHVWIRIEQSQFGSEVWLNGKRLGSYNGCYTSHEYDATDAVRRSGENELLVRVGRKDTLPPDNASGPDAEKIAFIPGIWGDVALILTGDPRIQVVRVTPRVDERIAEATVRIEAKSGPARSVTVSAVVLEKKTGAKASQEITEQVTIKPGRNREIVLTLPLPEMRTWSPENPFLYQADVSLKAEGKETDRVRATFGMRDFRIRGSDFFLNGKRVFLRGSNLAFHRFLSDPDRRDLPWDMTWAKKVVAALSNAYSSFGVSVELWDRHFFTNEQRRINVYVFNDDPEPREGVVICRILDGRETAFERRVPVAVAASGMQVLPVDWVFPAKPGRYVVEAGLTAADSGQPGAFSRKITHVFEQVQAPQELSGRRIVVHDPDDEILDFLKSRGLDAVPFRGTPLRPGDILVIGEGGLMDEEYASRLAEIGVWVEDGGTLVIVEPEYGAAERQQVKVTDRMEVTLRKRDSRSQGGYDSAVFPVNRKDPFWRGISAEHLSMFNGGLGGIMVSDHDVIPDGFFQLRARSGLGLGNAVLTDLISGNGAVVFSRLQVRGRLAPREKSDDLYARRVDPVAQRYLLNLLATYARYRTRGIAPFAGKVMASSGNDGDLAAACAVDGNPRTRWSSGCSDPQWIVCDLGGRKTIRGVTLTWEAAYGREYKILVSDDGRTWTDVFHESDGDGGVDEVTFAPVSARYVGLLGLRRATGWGYSLWEINVHSSDRQPREKEDRDE